MTVKRDTLPQRLANTKNWAKKNVVTKQDKVAQARLYTSLFMTGYIGGDVDC